MGKAKKIPTRWHEIKRLCADWKIDRQLSNSIGQAEYWSALAEQCQHEPRIRLLESTLHLPGNVIECGVFRGRSLTQIGYTLRTKAPDKSVFGLDSFEGFPEEKVTRVDVGFFRHLSMIRKKFCLCGDTPDRIRRIFRVYQMKGKVVKGYFSETLPRFSDMQFCFIHLDCDIYRSYHECLHALYDNLSPGGVIVFDEYSSPKWPGATRAVDEFLAERPESVLRYDEGTKASWYIRKQVAQRRHVA